MAVKTWIATTASVWSTAANWSGGTTPVSGDSIVFNAAGPGNCTVTGIPTIPFISLTTTGYTGQLIFNQTLILTGNITLSNTHTISSNTVGVLSIQANSTLTTNGCVLDLILRLGDISITVLLADNCVVNKGFQAYGTPLGSVVLQSSVPGTQRIFTVSNLVGTIQDIDYLNVTDLDSDAGISLWTYSGTVSNCRNWAVMPPQPPPISSISCS
jgi:hypothetical protein